MICFYLYWCFVCISVCVRVKSAGVIGSCELSCRFWQLNLSSLEEQPMILPLSYLSRPLAEFSKLMAPSYLFSANSIWLPWNQAVCIKPYQFNMLLYFRSAHNFIHYTLSLVLYPTKMFQSKIRARPGGGGHPLSNKKVPHKTIYKQKNKGLTILPRLTLISVQETLLPQPP